MPMRISISITERDLARLEAKAIEEGMSYRTLIKFHSSQIRLLILQETGGMATARVPIPS
jgi:hypothetical protein